jgi:hypothetical protein
LVAARWYRWNLWLGILSAIAAAIAAFVAGKGTIILKDLPHGDAFASGFALLSTILTSTLTFLAPSEKAGTYHHFSNKLRSLRDRLRSFIEITCRLDNKDGALCDKFERLVHEKSEIESSHPIVPNWAYNKAYAKIKSKILNKQSLESLESKQCVEPISGTLSFFRKAITKLTTDRRRQS